MKFLSVFLSVCILCLSPLFYSEAEAFVAMNANSAMRSDNFVDNSGRSGSNSSGGASARQAEKDRKIEEARARNKAVHDSFANPSVTPKESTATSSSKQEDEKKEAVSAAEKNIPVSEYNKKYASKFLKTFSGHITIEQKNLPRKIAISKGSTLELQMDGSKDSFWFITHDENILKIEKNKLENGKTIIIFKAIAPGFSRMTLDYISTVTPNYKVMFTKKFVVIVDD